MKKLIFLISLLFLNQSFAMDLYFEKNEAVPLVFFNFVVKAGSAHDPAHKYGLTKFLGEMMLRGTKNKTKEQINLEIDQMGATLEIETQPEVMILRAGVLKRELPHFLNLVEEILTQPSFNEKEIGKLKNEVLSQILSENSDDKKIIGKMANRLFFGNHPYAHTLLGTTQTVSSFTISDLKSHYAQVFKSQNAFVSATGDADENLLKSWTNQMSEKLKGETSIRPISAPEFPKKRRIILLDKPDRTQTQIVIIQKGATMSDPLHYALHLGNQVFGGGTFTARLMQEIRVKRGWSYGAYSYFRYGTQPRSYVTYLFPASKDTPQALKKTLDLIQDYRTKGITEEELKTAKDSLVNANGFSYNTPKKRVEWLLNEQIFNLKPGFVKTYETELPKLTVKDVNRAVSQFVDPSSQYVIVLGTASTLKGPMAQTLGISEDQIEVIPYDQE